MKRLPEINSFEDKADKPLAIHRLIGRRPIAAETPVMENYE